MEINKKHIVIAIVAAVAVYLVLKKRKENKTSDAGSTASSGTVAGLDKHNLDDCITAAFGGDTYYDVFAAKAREVYADNKQPGKIADFQAKADQKGYTFEQMATIDGAYLECYRRVSSSVWEPRDAAHKSYFDKVVARVKAM